MDGSVMIVNDEEDTEELVISPTSPVIAVSPVSEELIHKLFRLG